MPVLGERKSAQFGRGFEKDSMHGLAAEFKSMASNVVNESGYDFFAEPTKALMNASAEETIKNFFVENAFDPNEFTDPRDLEDQKAMMEAQYLNDKEAILEHSPIGAANPVIGISFPIHKNLLMNTVFDKAVPKAVAASPKFTISMETRILETPEGEEIDIFKEQNKIMAAIDATAPVVEVPVKLPECETVDILKDTFKATANYDALSIDTYISAVAVETYAKTGDMIVDPDTLVEEAATADGKALVWKKVNLKFTPGYGDHDRVIMGDVEILTTTDATGATALVKDAISGYMKKNKFGLNSFGTVKAVKLAASLDTSSAMLKTCTTKWKTRTDVVEIGNAKPINTTVSPEEVKDLAALYNVNQLTKIMSTTKVVLGNYKDDKIKSELDQSFVNLPDTNRIASTFDFAPREGYYSDHIEWRRKTFMEALDSYVTSMLQVLNDPNMTISVIGQSDLIRKITPTEYNYMTPSNIGPVELDYVKTVTSSDKRVYQFISSDKMRGNNNLIILLCPRNTDRIIYRVYDYQFYVSNEIRNASNYALPAIHAFERFKFVEYQPVQGRLKILNPTGLKEHVINDDPIGVSAMNNKMGLNPHDVVAKP